MSLWTGFMSLLVVLSSTKLSHIVQTFNALCWSKNFEQGSKCVQLMVSGVGFNLFSSARKAF